MINLTEEGLMIMEVEFDDLEDIKTNYFPDRSEEEIVEALNSVGEADCEVVGMMQLFFDGIDYCRKSNHSTTKET